MHVGDSSMSCILIILLVPLNIAPTSLTLLQVELTDADQQRLDEVISTAGAAVYTTLTSPGVKQNDREAAILFLLHEIMARTPPVVTVAGVSTSESAGGDLSKFKAEDDLFGWNKCDGRILVIKKGQRVSTEASGSCVCLAYDLCAA